MFNPKWLVGKTIASVDMRSFEAGDHAKSRMGKAHNPIIRFTDGTCITFKTQETEVGEYGMEINYHKREK